MIGRLGGRLGSRSLGALAIVAALATSAHADPRAFHIGSRPSWYLLGGISGGGTVGIGEHGGFLGGELSLVRLRQARYLGLYADGYYDWAVDGTYATGGLEVGKKFFGLDGGVAFRFADGNTDVGGTVRLFAAAGLFSIYARYAYFDSMDDKHVIQLGAMLKIPLASPFGGGPR